MPFMARIPNCVFLKVADGYGGHAQVLALFDRSQSPGYQGTDATTSTIDHIAFEVPLADFTGEKERLKALGLQVRTAEHACIGAPFTSPILRATKLSWSATTVVWAKHDEMYEAWGGINFDAPSPIRRGFDPRFRRSLDSRLTPAQPGAAVLHVYLCRKLWKPA